MTKEELKQEAEIYSYKLYHSKAWNPGEDMLVKAYLAGAEPREKRIAELEKENVELKIKKIPELERKIASIRGCHRVDLVKLKARTEQVARLKKENAELKKKKEEIEIMTNFCKACKKIHTDQLTKAKFLLKQLVDAFPKSYSDVVKDTLEEARKFMEG